MYITCVSSGRMAVVRHADRIGLAHRCWSSVMYITCVSSGRMAVVRHADRIDSLPIDVGLA